jgi:carboxyvinyl-carboxyphosphonate phosphorylmutase
MEEEGMKPTVRLRELIQKKEILVVPGAFDALSAKLIEAIGFEAVYMTGFGTAASLFGLPDIGLLTMTEMVGNAKRISEAVKIPVIADADTGYGNHLNATRTLEEYERAGVSAIHIEDQIFPKRCGHMEGPKLISIEDMVAKVRATAVSRKDKDFVLIVRTDAISSVGFDEAIRRGNIYLQEGADAIFVEAPATMEQLEKIPKLLKGPILISMGPKTPNLNFKRFEEMGYSIIIYPSISLTASFLAIRERLLKLRGNGIVQQWTELGIPFEEMLNFLGLKKYEDLEEKMLRDKRCL